MLRLSIIPLILPLFFLAACDRPPAERIKELVAASSPDVSEDDITFNGCELSISITTNAEGKAFSSLLMTRIDLANYDLSRGSVTVAESGIATISLNRRPVRNRMVRQAMRILEIHPTDLSLGGGRLTMIAPSGQTTVENRLDRNDLATLSQKDVRNLMSKEGGQIRFGLTSVVIGEGEVEPHKDGPRFEKFALAVSELPKPTTFSLSLFYKGDSTSEHNLVSGAVVVVPAVLKTTAASKEDALELGKALHKYQTENC